MGATDVSWVYISDDLVYSHRKWNSIVVALPSYEETDSYR